MDQSLWDMVVPYLDTAAFKSPAWLVYASVGVPLVLACLSGSISVVLAATLAGIFAAAGFARVGADYEPSWLASVMSASTVLVGFAIGRTNRRLTTDRQTIASLATQIESLQGAQERMLLSRLKERSGER
jgi:hypothetical protein